jgi:hypothetical protein
MSYAHGPLILALDRRIFDTTPEESLQARTSNLVACTPTMVPLIPNNISEARAQIRAGHHDIRTYFTDTAAPESTTKVMPNSPTAPTITAGSVPILAYSPSNNDFSRHKHKQLRFHAGAAAPVKSILSMTH